MWMIVMEPMPAGFTLCDEFKIISKTCADVIKKAMKDFHSLGFFHGDLRDTNVFVRQENDTWTCMLTDFDWSGKSTEVKYPIGVYRNRNVWRPEPYLGGKRITVEHDDLMVFFIHFPE
jgi:RIO-like serine/threonine protein kinase